jgi:hypothetical protein
MKYEYLHQAIKTAFRPLTKEQSKELVDSIMKKVRMYKRQV